MRNSHLADASCGLNLCDQFLDTLTVVQFGVEVLVHYPRLASG